MKKIKYLLVAIMAVMLCIMCLMTSTFSWFLRPAKEGGSLIWSGNYLVSDGDDVEMETYEVVETTSGISAGTISVTDFSNSNGLAQNTRKYYRTDIKNKNLTSAQSVSMYISGFKITSADNDSAYLGVNNPLKTYKNLSGSSVSYTMAYNNSGGDGSTRRVYFNPNGVWSDTSYYLYYNEQDPNNYPSYDSAKILMTSNGDGKYYVDLSKTYTKVFIANQSYVDAKSNDNAHHKNRSKEFEVKNDKDYIITIEASDTGYRNGTIDGITIPMILQYYQKITMTNGAKFTLDLKEGTHFTGGTVSYSVTSNSDVVELNESKLTAKNVGQAELTITVTDDSGNTATAKTTVEVVEKSLLSDIPVVTNCMVPKAVDKDTPSIVSVYWYINNEGSDGLTYTIDDVYLSL